MRISHLFIAISLTIAIAMPVIAEDTAQREFTTHLFNQKDYYRTITEAKRYLFFNPEGPSSEEMEILIGDAYIAGGDLKQGVAEYNAFISRHENSNRSPEIEYKIAKIMISEHDYATAITHFQKAITHPKVSQAVAEKSKKWTAILSASHLPTDPEIQITALEVDDKLRLELNSEFQKVEFKNPSTAGILSGILPGAGQWYVGRHQDAKTAFILNGVFIWGAIEAFNQSNTGVGAMMLLFEAGWYTGNIYSAISGAHKYNRLKKDKFILKNSIDLGVYVIHDDPTLSIATHISF